MTKTPVILAAGAAAALAFGIARAETITEKSGNSTATITQEPGTNMKRKVTKSPNGQTIVQESGNSKVVIHQSGGGGSNTVISRQSSGNDKDDADDMACPDKSTKGKTAGKAKSDDDDCDD